MFLSTIIVAAALATSTPTISAAGANVPAALGAPAPALPATLLDGTPLASEGVPGKVTVLNFWATWCPPCRAETADYAAAYRHLHANDVAFLGIDTTETAPIVKTFVSAKGVPYSNALAGPDLYNAYGISYIPTTIVLDAKGVVRARWVGGVTPAQLAQYVAAARAGHSATYISAKQREIDAVLAPRAFHLDGSASTRNAAIKTEAAAVAKVSELEARYPREIDFERSQRETGDLTLALGRAERAAATTTAERVEALRTLARGYGERNAWADAAQADRDALALAPNDAKLVDALAHAYYRQHDYGAMIEQAKRYTELLSKDGDGWSTLGLAFQRARQYDDAAHAYATALTLLESVAGTRASAPKPTSRADAKAAFLAAGEAERAIADVADTALDAANVDVARGDDAGAKRGFDLANTYADRLDPKGANAELIRNVRERTQEGLIAVALARGTHETVVSITPWTGADLPGSVASTFKYRLIVAGAPDASVTLNAQGLAPSWVASFCADGLCSPHGVTFTLPSSGVKTYEFQLVPPHPGDQPGDVSVAVAGGAVVAVPRNTAFETSDPRK